MRTVDYLRISITDRCNERCTYCMPEGFSDWDAKENLLTYEEILRVVSVSVGLGFRKFRITGGEPLLRRDAAAFLERMGRLPGVESLGLSTNATLLGPMAERLAKAGVRGVNISLDTIDPTAYDKLTGGRLEKCIEGTLAAAATGIMNVKLNTVLIRGINEDMLLPLARFAAEIGAPIRFIELMPITTTQVLGPDSFYSALQARADLSELLEIGPVERLTPPEGFGPAKYFEARWNRAAWDDAGGVLSRFLPGLRLSARPSGPSILGFISPLTDTHFCESCNKVRITPDGKLRPCLGDHLEFDLRSVLRSGGSDGDLRDVFFAALGQKPDKHEFARYDPARRMSAIGG
jgi:cyclic pyranopterin phosphate synthase